MKRSILIVFVMAIINGAGFGQHDFESDVIGTSIGDLELVFIGHGTLMFRLPDYVIHIDPVSDYADYGSLDDADLILVTHHHGDHLDPVAIGNITKPGTKIVCSASCANDLDDPIVMKNGDLIEVDGLVIDAVPAYNILHKRANGELFHPKGVGNGYVLTIGDKHIYIAGDTENIPEMAFLEDIHIAFLPMNMPYTMTPEMVAGAVAMFQPEILYPYHYGNTNTKELTILMKNNKDCEVRIRDLQ
jgi:L-ascorbate metabolism protein UlaG (beta-lactamase superfamily)